MTWAGWSPITTPSSGEKRRMKIIKNSKELARLVKKYKDLILPNEDIYIEFQPTREQLRGVECRHLYMRNDSRSFDFNGGDFIGENFIGGNFNGRNFNGRDFIGGNFNGRDFIGRNFYGLDFNGRNFIGENFIGW